MFEPLKVRRVWRAFYREEIIYGGILYPSPWTSEPAAVTEEGIYETSSPRHEPRAENGAVGGVGV